MATQVGAADVLPGVYPYAGVSLTLLSPVAAPDIIEYPNTGDDLMVFYNTTGGPVTVTMNAGVDRYGRADGAQVVTGAGNIVVFGPLYPNDGWPVGGGNLRVTPGDTGVKVACVALGRAG